MPRRKIQTPRAPTFVRTFMLLGIFIAATLLALQSNAAAPPWESKEWTQWTKDDCELVLRRSPWVSTYAASASEGRVLITSSLVVRQAIVRLGQQDALCLNKSFDDRIEVSIFPDSYHDFSSAPDLIISGRRYKPFQSSQGDPPLDRCIALLPYVNVQVYAYSRVPDGKPVVGPGDKNIVIAGSFNRLFEFNIKKMTYKGKPDF